MENLYSWLIAAGIVLFFVVRYWLGHRKREKAAIEAAEHGKLFSDGPRAQHPHINLESCIGCGTCVDACPEGDVLGLLNGKATIVKGHKCIGHSICAEVCPVGAITMVMAKASASADMPALTPEFETSIPNLFIAGELGGLALIKNAVNQGRECVDLITSRLPQLRETNPSLNGHSDVIDVIIVGAGPAGISASLRATQNGITHMTLERESVGGTVSKYPRQKLVMTSPVEFPLYGKFNKTQLSKEELLGLWEKVMSRADLNIKTGMCVDTIKREDDGIFSVKTCSGTYRSRSVVMALGRAGTPRKLGVTGEELPHVLYRLIEADHYTNNHILVVGGGDSAVEAAMGLAHQPGNKVTMSYRRGEFSRLKDRNTKRIEEHIKGRKLEVLFNSMPTEFRNGSVLIDVGGSIRELQNDYVWIFAGGIPPTDFLKATGIAFGAMDVSSRTE
ncbi:MAG TPA: NAD(P)-binding domain-containing protein [Terracidiphilus sp.]|jgi:thioredoxin reductase/Pyruvate/2-oxoacid:ferredoxin oxidoreductase delta subunit